MPDSYLLHFVIIVRLNEFVRVDCHELRLYLPMGDHKRC